MAPNPETPQSGKDLLRSEFERTRLPRNGLADFLPLDPASVSRLLTGQRMLDPEERALARGYFSIVPDGMPGEEVEAIALLRSAKVRKFVAHELLRAFAAEGHRDPLFESFIRLIEDRTASQTLRSDQIVAICRVMGISLAALTGGHGATGMRWPQTLPARGGTDALSVVDAASRDWAGDGLLVPYEFDRGRRSRPAGSIRQAETRRVRVAPIALPQQEFGTCSGLAILESKPFPPAAGREIFLAPPGSDVRSGDIVVVMTGDAAAMIGKLSLVTPEKVVVELPDGRLESFPTGPGYELRRVAFIRV